MRSPLLLASFLLARILLQKNDGNGVPPYLVNRFEANERKGIVLVAHMRFNEVVNAHNGSETEKIAAAKKLHPRTRNAEEEELNVPQLLYKMSHEGGGPKGMLGQILSFV